MKPLCVWHRTRIAKYYVVKCGCKSIEVGAGDAIARQMFRLYHRCWDMAVVDYIDTYCCGSCQNANTETHMCGVMRICPNHLEDHDSKTLVEIEIENKKDI